MFWKFPIEVQVATVLTSIDYAKLFNRLSFQHCLRSFKDKGTSTPVIRLLATFLTDRSMRVRVGQAWSSTRHVTGGCPQGSILGVFLFNITKDDLEDGSAYVSSPGAPEIIDEELYNAPADNLEDIYRPITFSDQSSDNDSDNDSFHSAKSSLSSCYTYTGSGFLSPGNESGASGIFASTPAAGGEVELSSPDVSRVRILLTLT